MVGLSQFEIAHALWKKMLRPGDVAVDATCGNGHDTLILAQTGARVIGFDIQQGAIEATHQRVAGLNVQLHQTCHTQVARIVHDPVKVAVFNLGYLPGGDKSLTTQASTTVETVDLLLPMIEPGGLISITCYPGHPEGAREQKRLVDWSTKLPPNEWTVTHQQWINRAAAPSLLLLQKN